MIRRLKHAGGVPEELMPKIKGDVTVAQLEEIAVKSQEGKEPKGGGPTSLAEFEYCLGEIKPKLDEVKKAFPGETILCAAVDCDDGHAVAELNRLGGVEAFGTGGDFRYGKQSGLPRERYIISDSRGLPRIPGNSFHLVMHMGTFEPFESLKKQVSAIYRVTKPGGIAVMDIEDWNMFTDIVTQLGMTRQAEVVDNESGEKTGLVQFVNSVVDVGEKNPIKASQRTYNVHFELRKPR